MRPLRMFLLILPAGLMLLTGPLFAADPLFASDQLFDLKKAADGVYLAVARPQTKINSNAAVIVLEDGVLIVDTHSKPSAARALMEQIKTVTSKPIRYVVDTHFHWDHYQGNAAYPQSYPEGIEIISSAQTRRNIVNIGLPRIRNEIVRLPKAIETMRQEMARATGDRRRELAEEIRGTQQYLDELKSTEAVVPNLTFENSLSIYRKDRTVQILFMGRAHTDGDVIVYLPREKIVATGDLLQGKMPYMGDSHPFEWIRTLAALERLDFETVLPGHGDLLKGKQRLRLWKEYLTELMRQVSELYSQGATIEETLRSVDLSSYESRIPGFRGSVAGNIEKAYRVISFED